MKTRDTSFERCPRRARRLAAGALAALLLVGCHDANLPSATEPETGEGLVYRLRLVNDKSVPQIIQNAGVSYSVSNGALTLSSDSTWIFSLALTTVGNNQNSSSVSTLRGQYSVTGTALSMTQGGELLYTGTFSASEVVLTDAKVQNGDRYVFRR